METLLKSLNIKYKDLNLYKTALTHSSYANENGSLDNERLEFLGDAVIELLTSEYLYNDSNDSEGKMTVKRAQAVREEALVMYSHKINLSNYMLLGQGEKSKGANDAMIADALEALFGAVYLELGLLAVRKLFRKIIVPNLNEAFTIKDYKSILQEIIHSGVKRNISYKITDESGPSHNKSFESVVLLDKEIILGSGKGRTKKEAEQEAAKEALRKGMYDFTKTT